MPHILDWIRLFEGFGENEGTLFCINLMNDGEYFNARVGFEKLNDKILMGADIPRFENELKSIALMSKDTLKRTWAKKLLRNYEEVKQNPPDEKTNRSIKRMLLDIEKLILSKEQKTN